MKRKYFLVVLFLILAIFLTGCSGGMVTPTIPLTDEAKVRTVINEYFLAINDQNWTKAKNYCVYGSDRYYATRYLEDAIHALQQLYDSVTITCLITISNVMIYGSFAEALASGTIIISAGGYYESESGTGIYYLQKIGNNWKIYDP